MQAVLRLRDHRAFLSFSEESESPSSGFFRPAGGREKIGGVEYPPLETGGGRPQSMAVTGTTQSLRRHVLAREVMAFDNVSVCACIDTPA